MNCHWGTVCDGCVQQVVSRKYRKLAPALNTNSSQPTETGLTDLPKFPHKRHFKEQNYPNHDPRLGSKPDIIS